MKLYNALDIGKGWERKFNRSFVTIPNEIKISTFVKVCNLFLFHLKKKGNILFSCLENIDFLPKVLEKSFTAINEEKKKMHRQKSEPSNKETHAFTRKCVPSVIC